MAAINDYYGRSRGWKTYLEIYSRKRNSEGKRQIHRQLTDQEAYDTWHLSFYLKEILSYKRLAGKKSISLDDIPRKEKNLLVYLILAGMKKHSTLVELGHSLFELIDGLETVDAYFRKKKSSLLRYPLKSVNYTGIDLSDDLCLTSKILHPDYAIKTFNSVSRLPTGNYDLLYDRNVSSYAFSDAHSLAEFMNRFDVALMNLFVSRSRTFLSKRLGKSLTYFSLPQLAAHLKKPLFHLFGEKAPGPFRGEELSRGKNVIEGFFLMADPIKAELFMDTARRHQAVRSYIGNKKIRLTAVPGKA